MATTTHVDVWIQVSTPAKLPMWTRFRKSPSTRIPNPADSLRVDVWTVWTPFRGVGARPHAAPPPPLGAV
jgi:hypothetical protein